MSIGDKPRLLYIMGIDWEWIFQRPQIIEQHLERSNNVTVVFPRSILKFFARHHEDCPQHYRILWTLPLQEKVKIIGKISRAVNRHIFRDVWKYETVVIGYPLYYRYIPRDYSGILIYDCMDNHEALYCYRRGVEELLKQEKELILHSHLVFASSQKLVEKLQGYNISPMPRMVLLRNGTMVQGHVNASQMPDIAKPISRTHYDIGYVGTVAGWFDTDLILESLRAADDITYHLIGPVRITLPDEHRLVSEGVIKHDRLCEAVQSYSCLVMPFKKDNTVLYVDPVKLYEYITMGKCIIAVYYPEIERFKDFVYFYHSSSDYIGLLDRLKALGFPPKYTFWQRQAFLEENSWQARFAIWDRAFSSIRQQVREVQGGQNEYQSNERIWHQTGGNQDVSSGKRTGKASGYRKHCMPDRAAQGDATTGD